MQNRNYDILGIGNAVTDIFVEVEGSFLKENNLVEGAMKLVDENFINEPQFEKINYLFDQSSED